MLVADGARDDVHDRAGAPAARPARHARGAGRGGARRRSSAEAAGPRDPGRAARGARTSTSCSRSPSRWRSARAARGADRRAAAAAAARDRPLAAQRPRASTRRPARARRGLADLLEARGITGPASPSPPPIRGGDLVRLASRGGASSSSSSTAGGRCSAPGSPAATVGAVLRDAPATWPCSSTRSALPSIDARAPGRRRLGRRRPRRAALELAPADRRAARARRCSVVGDGASSGRGRRPGSSSSGCRRVAAARARPRPRASGAARNESRPSSSAAATVPQRLSATALAGLDDRRRRRRLRLADGLLDRGLPRLRPGAARGLRRRASTRSPPTSATPATSARPCSAPSPSRTSCPPTGRRSRSSTRGRGAARAAAPLDPAPLQPGRRGDPRPRRRRSSSASAGTTAACRARSAGSSASRRRRRTSSLYDEDANFLGRAKHVMLALGHGPLSFPRVLAQAREEPGLRRPHRPGVRAEGVRARTAATS